MKNRLKLHKGFTLIELLVVISIIGLLSTLAVVSFGNARQKSRDTKRLSDIKAIQSGLELYFGDKDAYPVEDPAITLGDSAHLFFGPNGFKSTAALAGSPLYMNVPKDPTSTYNYTYGISGGTTYSITFKTEQTNVSGLAAGADHVASPAGMQ